MGTDKRMLFDGEGQTGYRVTTVPRNFINPGVQDGNQFPGESLRHGVGLPCLPVRRLEPTNSW